MGNKMSEYVIIENDKIIGFEKELKKAEERAEQNAINTGSGTTVWEYNCLFHGGTGTKLETYYS